MRPNKDTTLLNTQTWFDDFSSRPTTGRSTRLASSVRVNAGAKQVTAATTTAPLLCVGRRPCVLSLVCSAGLLHHQTAPNSQHLAFPCHMYGRKVHCVMLTNLPPVIRKVLQRQFRGVQCKGKPKGRGQTAHRMLSRKRSPGPPLILCVFCVSHDMAYFSWCNPVPGTVYLCNISITLGS